MRTVYVVYGVPEYQDQDVHIYGVFAEEQQAIDCYSNLSNGLDEDGNETDEYFGYIWNYESIVFIE